jgi:hypothetical protein
MSTATLGRPLGLLSAPSRPLSIRPRRRSRWALFAGPLFLWPLSLFLSALALVPGSLATSQDAEIPIWVAAATLAMLLPALRRRPEGVRFPDAIWLLSLLHIAYFPLRAAALHWMPQYATPALDSLVAVRNQTVPALKLVTLAGCAMHWGGGLTLGPLRTPRLLQRLWVGQADPSLIAAWLALGFAGFLARLACGIFSSVWEFRLNSSVGVAYGLIIDLGAVTTVAAFAFARKRSQRLPAAVLLALSTVAMFFYAFKGPFAIQLLMLLAAHRFRTGRSPRVRTLFFVALTTFVVFPLIQGKRAAESRSDTTTWDDVAAFYRPSTGDSSGPAGAVLSGLGNVSNRFHGQESLCIILAQVPDMMPHSGVGSLVARFWWTFVPRVIFREKPIIHQGLMFKREFVHHGAGEESGASIAMFQIAEAYYVGGVAFLMTIGFLLGWYSRLLSRLTAAFEWPRFFPYYCLLLFVIIGVERDIVLSWTEPPRVLFLLWGVTLMIRRAAALREGRLPYESFAPPAPRSCA